MANITLDERIEKQKLLVFSFKEKYEQALAELEQLQKKKREIQSQQLIKAFETSSKSLEEVLTFLKGNDEGDK